MAGDRRREEPEVSTRVNVRVSERELRLNTVDVLRRVEAGEPLTVTVDGRPVADLMPRSVQAAWSPKRHVVVSVDEELSVREPSRDDAPEATGDVFGRAEAVWKRYE